MQQKKITGLLLISLTILCWRISVAFWANHYSILVDMPQMEISHLHKPPLRIEDIPNQKIIVQIDELLYQQPLRFEPYIFIKHKPIKP